MNVVSAGRLKLTPQEVIKNYFDGQSALVIAWPSKAFFGDDELQIESVMEQTVVSRVPASKRWFDFSAQQWNDRDESLSVDNTGFAAFQASMLASANYPTTVYDFLTWIGSKQTTTAVVSNSLIGSPSRNSHLGNTIRWTGDVLAVEASDKYSEIVQEINNETVALTFPRIPGSDRYLESLGRNVRKCLEGNLSVESALQSVEQEWNTITDELGREEQKEHMRMDFGL